MNLRQLGEERLLQRMTRSLRPHRFVLAGAGDDCAVTQFGASRKLLLLKTDCVVEGVHFQSNAPAPAVGWKAMARPLSDFAAMSGLPEFALITLLAPAKTNVQWVKQAYRGLARAARRFNVAIVGGETSRIDGPLAISVSVAGSVEKGRWVSRRGGKRGDELFVSGRLGGSIRGKHLRFIPRIAEARWLTENFRINAMIDLSDGLGADLPRLARASGLAFELDESAVPRTPGCTVEEAISDGEDYELLFAIRCRQADQLAQLWKKTFPNLLLTRIGRLIEGGAKNDQQLAGYVHFQ